MLERLLPEGMSGERVVQLLALPSGGDSEGATSVLKLKDGVSLQRVVLCREGEELMVGSSTSRLLRLEVNENNLPVMGRNAQGPVLQL